MNDADPKRPPTLEEFRKAYHGELREIARDIAEQYIQGRLPERPRRINRPSTPPKPETFLPGLEPHQRKGGRR